MLDVKLLAVFREVALRGSFTAAANVLAYTPSAISRQMAVLDRLAEAVERMSSLATGARGRLRLGSFPAATGAFVGLAIRRESNGPQSAPVYRSRVPTQQSTREENVTTTITPTTTREGVSRLRERGRP